MLRYDDVFGGGIDNPMGASFQRGFEKGNDFCRFSDQSVGKLFVERDKVANIYITIVLLEEDVLANLIPGKILTMSVICMRDLTCK